MNVSLTDALKDWVAGRVAEGSFATPSDYIRHLIREDRNRAAQHALETALLRGLQSGAPIADREMDWDGLTAEALTSGKASGKAGRDKRSKAAGPRRRHS